jgi:hypothetical protein
MRKTSLMLVVVVCFLATQLAAAACTPTGFSRDGINLTAALINPTAVSGTVDATGCNIGVYFDHNMGSKGVIDNATITGANYFGVVVNGETGPVIVDITGSEITGIGETTHNGAQHGVAIYYRSTTTADTATGTISGNDVLDYQKGGIVAAGPGTKVSISTNIVIGVGAVDYIAQNGIQVSSGAAAIISGNAVSDNTYTGGFWTSCGILYYDAGGVKAMRNFVAEGNQMNFCNFGKGTGNVQIVE